LIKLCSDFFELNIWIDAGDIEGLKDIGARKIKYYQAGKSANSAVHWVLEAQTAYILIGDDQEAWDIALSVDIGFIKRLIRVLDKAVKARQKTAISAPHP
jgi:hypothetical protein